MADALVGLQKGTSGKRKASAEPEAVPPADAPRVAFVVGEGSARHVIVQTPITGRTTRVSLVVKNEAAAIAEALKVHAAQNGIGLPEGQELRLYQDFPTPGVGFLDLFSAFVTPTGATSIVAAMADQVRTLMVPALSGLKAQAPPNIAIVGLESRGLMLGFALAAHLQVPFLPMRKPGKLPGTTVSESFTKEYGDDRFEVQADAAAALGDRELVVVDDVLATGGSASAAIRLAGRAWNRKVAVFLALMDIPPLRPVWTKALGVHGTHVVVMRD